MATRILPSPSSGFESECREIHEAQWKTSRLVRALAARSKAERRQIQETYKAMYGEDLMHIIEQKRIEAPALYMWMLDSHVRDAVIVREALQGGEVDFKAVIEIFVGRKSSHIGLMRQAYQERFRRQLDQDIINIEPLHSYQKILLALAASHKAHHVDVSQHIAKCDAKRLYESDGGSKGAIEEPLVLEILSKRSIPQLKLTFSYYKHIYGNDYIKSLKKGIRREFGDALKMVVKCMCDPPKYYAQALYASIKGANVERARLGRIMVTRAETDIDDIQSIFIKKYGIKLQDAICESEPSGDYRDFLIVLASKSTACS